MQTGVRPARRAEECARNRNQRRGIETSTSQPTASQKFCDLALARGTRWVTVRD